MRVSLVTMVAIIMPNVRGPMSGFGSFPIISLNQRVRDFLLPYYISESSIKQT